MPPPPPVSEDLPVTDLPAGGPNPIGVALGLLGDEWTLLILRHALQGVRLYGGWTRELPISHAVLTARLGRLTEAGLLDRVAYQRRPERFEYRLTRRGRGVWPILLGIWSWELSWVPDHVEALPRMRHRSCGRLFAPVLVCGSCGVPAAPRDLVGGFGPSGTWERSMPTATTRRRSSGAHQAGFFPQTTALVGNRWSCALLGAAFRGTRRFSDFERQLSAPPVVVADRLRTFADLGVMTADYRLTAKGLAFFPVVVHTVEWAQTWFRSPEGLAMAYHHRPCGAAFHPRYACSACAVPLRAGTIDRVFA